MFSDNIKFSIAGVLISGFIIYTAFLYAVLPFPKYDHTALAGQGKQIWQSNNCNACHQIYGLGGFLGPDLTNVYSQKGKEYIRSFVAVGTNVMPAFHLSDIEMKALVEYLHEVDVSGVADPRSFTIISNGSIEQ